MRVILSSVAHKIELKKDSSFGKGGSSAGTPKRLTWQVGVGEDAYLIKAFASVDKAVESPGAVQGLGRA